MSTYRGIFPPESIDAKFHGSVIDETARPMRGFVKVQV